MSARAVVFGVDAFARSLVDRATVARSPLGIHLNARERGTLEIGSAIVLGTLGAGLQVGQWPLWTALVALAGYLAWTVLYSEATIQATRWRWSAGASLPAEPVTPPA